jgi:FAD/FMN-containing dehydrogenase
MDLNELRSQIRGDVVAISDPEYEAVRRSLVWNELKPLRRPALIVQVFSEQDVVAAVRFAREHRFPVAVRGGGHSWVAFSLRDNSLLIDLGRLKGIRINADRSAVVQPAATGREVNAKLAAHGRAFPVGHCPTVPMSGFLLSGGLGWNAGRWGPACLSIRSANVVTADGELVVADENHNEDLFWAIRGGGPGFFGVITQYELETYPIPRAITASNFFYSLDRIAEVGTRVAAAAVSMPKQTELTVFVAPAPPQFAEQCKSSNGYVAIVNAVAFVDSPSEAAAILGKLETALPPEGCLGSRIGESMTMDGLLDLGGSLWPERHRYLADTLWSNAPAAQPLDTLRAHFARAPSPKSVAVYVVPTGVGEGSGALPDVAFSMTAKALLLCYAVWEREEDDPANAAWHSEAIAALDEFAVGHYVGESDIVTAALRAERSYAPANWKRLRLLREKYDPGGLFLGHFR